MDRGSSRQHAGPRRSALSLRDDFASCSMSSTTGGYSLAHELVSALEPSESGARSLAEEFGIDLGEEEDRDSSRSESPSGSPSSHLYDDHDPQFANPNDLEPDPFSISHEFDDQQDHFNHFNHEISEFEDEQDGSHHQGMSLGDELTLGDELEMELNGIPRQDEEEDLQTPTRAKGPRRIRSRTASSFRSQGSRSTLGFGMAPSTSLGPSPSASSSRSSSPSRLRSTSGSSMVDDDSDTDSPPPQRLFGSSSIPSTPNSAPSSMSVQDTILLPPTFLPLLAKDDRSFELEHATAAVVKTMEDMGRQREGMCRELGGLDRELQRLIGEGARFSDSEGGEDGFGMGSRIGPMGSLVEDEDEEDDEEDRSRSDVDDEEDDLDDEDRSGTARLNQTHFEPSPVFSRNSTPRKSRPPNPFAPQPPPSRSTPSSPSSNALLEPPADPNLLPSISTLTTLTSSLLTSLSSLHDASQITLSSAADAGRRLRALRTTFAGMKADEEVVEKAWKSVIEWEEGEGRKKEEGGRVVKDVVEKEMAGFRRTVDEFDERTKVIREDHNRFLVGFV
ncbi:hypothetical protein BDY24DRAFT_402382 [Mrakia frigida]|uniref:uncharacterized protein n=1 Tax=Mrakia frigida TaxID=29902 RepID=UPI003FCC24E0